ncbi:MAG: ABC transporter permease, partial [Anaerolineae bacterium]|nr:ABC transporter permease [Anaerolineae bacterium]
PDEQSGQAAGTELQTVLLRVLSAAKAATISADVAADPALDGPARLAYAQRAVLTALDAWKSPPVTMAVEKGGLRPEEAGLDNSYAQSSPGMLVQFGIAGVMGSATLLVGERKKRTLERLLTTATHRSEIIAGKLLAAFTLTFGQMMLLTGFGQLVYGLPYYDHPMALLLLSAVFAATIACMGLLVGAIAKTDEAVVILTLIPVFVLSALGGAWLPLEVMPEGMRTLGRIITPTAWTMEAYQDLIVRGQGLQAVLLPVGVIAAWGVGFFLLAIWRLRFVEG